MTKTKKWRAFTRALREKFPVEGKVNVIRYPCKKFAGSVRIRNNGNFTIRINSRQEWDGQIDSLLHEWAHMLTIEEAFSHSAPWGDKFAEIYRAIIQE